MRIPPSFAGQRNYPGLFWSTTNRDHVVYESLLELSWLWLADFDATVVRIAAQPLRVVGPDRSRQRVRLPDFVALDAWGRSVVVDVKPARLLVKPEVQASLAWTSRVMGEAGIAYAVWSGAPAVVLRNVRLTASARRPGLVPEEAIGAAVEFCPADGCSIGDPRGTAPRPRGRPGTSPHGWGMAVDLDLNAQAQSWMRANAGRFGFVEDTPREPWHWVYRA